MKHEDYTYSATGQKLAVEHSVAQPNVTWAFGVKPDISQHQAIFAGHTDYLLGGSLIVKEGTTRMLLFDGGYAKADRIDYTTYDYTLFYYTQDHLGNNREVLDANGTLHQKTSYYPFGAPYTILDGAASTDLQPYKYNGKELDLVHGLNTYDYGARQYFSILGRWDRMDPLCEKYYSLSPYNYCGNNPVNAIDERGDSICVLNYGYGTHQHLAMLIQNDQGKWQYYSINGNNQYYSGFFSGGRTFNDISVGSWSSPEEFLNSSYNQSGESDDITLNHYGFSEGFVISSNPKQDEIMRKTFTKISNEVYHLLSNNCATAVTRTMEAAGIRTHDETEIAKATVRWTQCGATPIQEYKAIAPKSIIPSKAFMSIQICNPQGQYIHK